jgi:hypothetical protein
MLKKTFKFYDLQIGKGSYGVVYRGKTKDSFIRALKI